MGGGNWHAHAAAAVSPRAPKPAAACLLDLLRHGAKRVHRRHHVCQELLHKGAHVGGVCGRQAQHVGHDDGRHHHVRAARLHALEHDVEHLG